MKVLLDVVSVLQIDVVTIKGPNLSIAGLFKTFLWALETDQPTFGRQVVFVNACRADRGEPPLAKLRLAERRVSRLRLVGRPSPRPSLPRYSPPS